MAAVSCVYGAAGDEAPTLNVVTTFPDNPFSLVQNGRANRVVLSITNPPSADRALLLEEITGAFLNPKKLDGQRGRVLRNMTATKVKSVPITNVGGQPLQVPFDFYSEFKPQSLDVEFFLKVMDQGNSKRYTLPVYRGSVVIEEPKPSWFDPQLLSVYALMALVAAGIAYLVYETYIATYFRANKPLKQRVVKPQPKPTSSTDSQEWLPEQTRKPRKAASKRK
ncbi:hypothetical protein MPSI1_003389 [Malassezia psittaci]|uniref:Translocon-associated protein subunit alpha n=1 Tax=Malassezia psittaci TaxID=1821823 RepID=A0AAF0FDV8_9BASI|nr:hypothetical protein MPSI1_003389 [Malassezia psittaci]